MRMAAKKTLFFTLTFFFSGVYLGTYLSISRLPSSELHTSEVGQSPNFLRIPSKETAKAEFIRDFQKILETYGHRLAKYDIEEIAPQLSMFYKDKTHMLLDVGCNQGRVTERYLKIFNDLDCWNYRKSLETTKRIAKSCLNSAKRSKTGDIFCFEASRVVFDFLEKRAEEEKWYTHPKLHIVHSAVGDQNLEQVSFFSMNDSNAGRGSLSHRGSNYGKRAIEMVVPMVRLDTFLGEHWNETGAEKDIFLLKIDVEGFDKEVLVGMGDLLERRKVKFLTFEYNWNWKTGKTRRNTLESVVTELLPTHYLCFYITKDDFIPVSGFWWDGIYEIWKVSNIFCGLKDDDDLKKILLSKNRDTSRVFAVFN